VAIRARLTTADTAAAPAAKKPAAADSGAKREFTEEEKAARKERVAKAKDAMARSVGLKGDHVAPARAALKTYLQRLNLPNQPDDATFEALCEAPFKAPEKKRTGDRGGPGGRR
jgi:peptidoglycan hydrolase-like protein with peptidoglycan-binding domain